VFAGPAHDASAELPGVKPRHLEAATNLGRGLGPRQLAPALLIAAGSIALPVAGRRR